MYQNVLHQIRDRVCSRLQALSPHLTYHNVAHTLDVARQCGRIATAEHITDEHDRFLLLTAAYYHDSGFLETYQRHEEASCTLFREDATGYGIGEEDAERVCSLIMATKVPQQPQNLMQQVLCDADLDYLGRSDFFSISDALRQEFLHYGIVADNNVWESLQDRFISGHRYHTASSRALREPVKQRNYAQIAL